MYRLIYVVQSLFKVYYIMILIRVFLSWLPHNPTNSVISFIYEVTELLIGPSRRILRRYLNHYPIGIDFSPLVALIILQLIEWVIIRVLLILM